MADIVCCIPADDKGNKLFIRDFRIENNKAFVMYKSTYNNMPFIETEIFVFDGGENAVITGTDGTILFRFSMEWILKLMEDNL